MTTKRAPTYVGDLYTQAAQFQAALDALDAGAAQQMTAAWAQVYGRIRVDLDDVTSKIAAAAAAGQPVKPGWLYQQGRMKNLLRTAKGELARYGTVAGVVTKGAQAAAVAAATKHAAKQIQTAAAATLPTVDAVFDTVNPENLKHLVGTLADGSPLRDLFDTIPGQGAAELERRLVQGVALGWNANKIAQHASDGLLLSRQRAILISRTETLRAYRETSRLSYEASPVVGGWAWTAALDRRTCVACVMMHGTVHPTTERLDGHPACRCRMVPVTKSYAELGLGDDLADSRPTLQSGKDWLLSQPIATQQAILGPGKWKAYAAGDVSLDDMVARRSDPRWGTMRYERSLKDIAAGRNANYGQKPQGPVLRGQSTALPEGYFGVDLPEGYFGVKLPVTHPAYPLPSPSAKGVSKVLGKINSGAYTKADLQKIVATGKYKNSAKPLKPQDYAAHKQALAKIDARAAQKAVAKAQADAVGGLPPTPEGVDKFLGYVKNMPPAKQIEALQEFFDQTTLPQSKADLAQALKQIKGTAAPLRRPLGKNAYQFREAPFDVEDLTLDPDVRLGGAHTKQVYVDKDGDRWLYKPQDDFRAQVDTSVNTLQDMLGLKAPDTYVVQINGQTGSIQRMIPGRNAFGDSPSLFDPSKLQPHDVLELQKHDLFDWLVSNHDGHAQQFIRGKGPGGPGNPLIGIDKGQAFRFFGKDRLDYTYEPNATYGVTKVSNVLNRATAQGRPPAGWQSVADPNSDLRAFAERIRDLDDETYASLLRPYAEQAQARGLLAYGDVDEFLGRAVDRKRKIVEDFAQFHARIEDERDQVLKRGKYAPVRNPGDLRGMEGAVEHDVGRHREQAQTEAHAYWSALFDQAEIQRRLTPAERAAVQKYTGSSYTPINEALRSGNVGGAVKDLVDQVRSAIDKVSDLIREDVIVHRAVGFRGIEGAARGAGISMGHREDMQALVGARLADPGFMSASVGHTPRYGDRDVVLRMRVPAGARGIYVSNGLSAQGQGEYELVLGDGYEFHVHDARRTPRHGGSWELDVELIPLASPARSTTRRKARP